MQMNLAGHSVAAIVSCKRSPCQGAVVSNQPTKILATVYEFNPHWKLHTYVLMSKTMLNLVNSIGKTECFISVASVD